jgi:hypothetical protein
MISGEGKGCESWIAAAGTSMVWEAALANVTNAMQGIKAKARMNRSGRAFSFFPCFILAGLVVKSLVVNFS